METSGVYKITNTITGDFYNGTILTLGALSGRFKRANITHYCIEAKKYLLREIK